MKFTSIKPKQSLNKAFLKKRPLRDEIDKFKANFIRLLSKVSEIEREENQKNHIRDFLRDTYYLESNEINTKDSKDLVIHLGKTNKEKVGVIIEAKRPGNKSEMFSPERPFTKALSEIILYYLDERSKQDNNELKNLIITNVYEWYIFDANVFDKVIYRNTKIKNLYQTYLNDKKDTPFFYEEVVKILPTIDSEIICTQFDIRDYDNIVRNDDKSDDKNLIALYKILSPNHLLKVPFADDSNSLDSGFYKELLHIIGLEEIKDSGKFVIQRKKTNRNSGSLIENTINLLETEGFGKIHNLSTFGDTRDEQLFNIALELVITWINRILFLKLLESQLVSYHNGDKSYRFLNKGVIFDFDELYKLFHQVLARLPKDRTEKIQSKYIRIPYLNSSLFEISDIEQQGIKINSLDDSEKLEFFGSTILKEDRKISKSLPTIEYLFKFLDAYDFAGESSEEIQEESKLLINSSVLGKVFEKINGYKDGSFFTPGFITMYMCRESIRLAVVQKFRVQYGWNIEHFNDIKNYLVDRKTLKDILEFNEVINSLRICDPAVGSGHFLVSALNEMIAIKSELGILADSSGTRIRDYEIVVENDELIITNFEGDIFEYKIRNNRPLNSEIQRLQKTLFQEKQTIIENCLFGVDINPKSVIICRLRLWIELLKNAYYKEETGFKELETLPNIDINIKCGNSLVSRFPLDSDLKKALKSIKYDIKAYQGFVQDYKNEKNREVKQELQKLINDIKNHFSKEINQLDKRMIDFNNAKGELEKLQGQFSILMSDADKLKYEKEVEIATKKKLKYEAIFNDFTYNPLYDNAFEWRFEFPEVLNENGDFVGFDVVIGNPPYFSITVLNENIKKVLASLNYSTFTKSTDIYTIFIERGFQMLNNSGLLAYITSNKWMRAGYGEQIRGYLSNRTNPLKLIDFCGFKVFESATVDTNIIISAKFNENNFPFYACNVNKDFTIDTSIENYFGINKQLMPKISKDAWVISSNIELQIKEKIERIGTPLKDWDLIINRGITSGLNDAFIINNKKKDELIAKNPKSAEIIKPILRGRDIKRFKVEFADLWIINSHNGIKEKNIPRIDIPKDFPELFEHLKKYENELLKRLDQGDHWTNLRNCAYIEEFDKEKICFSKASKEQAFYNNNSAVKYYLLNTCYFIIHKNSNIFLTSILNSKLARFAFLNYYQSGGINGEITIQGILELPIPKITPEEQKPFIDLVDIILAKKEKNEDTSKEEKQIDLMVYKLYELTYDEVKIIEPEFDMSSEEYERFEV
ncbi:MAG: class I SAM-dependent DNA methyltransferase [Candidatus Kapabacteria bacterium]|nr:class I SAM-dependent DNA methyltransferase [Ignavibacteriota bacterium]MCW5885369.1 class I SAM-dependent DNA methyltransferase [Candidatus Kapabacteria bacterium]